MKYSICIDSLFQGDDFYKSLRELKNIGVNSFEFWSWWDKNLYEIKKVKDELNMRVITFCTKFVPLNDSDKIDIYYDSLKETIKAADLLDCDKIITQVGNEKHDISREKQKENIVIGLKKCVHLLKKTNKTLMIEPLNKKIDHIGTFLYSSKEAFEIVNKVGSDNVKVLYDIYHQSVMGEDIIGMITKNINLIGHFHAASYPNRGRIDKGEINYTQIFETIEELNYEGYVGLEYFSDKNMKEKIEILGKLI